ncbi:hypothetical protein [Cytobacillus pseudoceanisediminis]|uniref:hypothetical protein n=1 Tax=Cytobacillus pseudoceanisediminis TaxID=3051614 RepID=UPI003CFB3697
MPAASVYFYDPDGHSLEYIAVLEGEARPYLNPTYLSEWEGIKYAKFLIGGLKQAKRVVYYLCHHLRKKVIKMKIIGDNGFYEVEYDNEHYDNLEFVRIDQICEINYVTMKNTITGEVYTFEADKIRRFRKLMKLMPEVKENLIADSSSYSL